MGVVLLNPYRFGGAAAPGAYETQVLADSPLAYWRFDEASGSVAADLSGNARDMTYSGGILAQTAVNAQYARSAKGGTSGYGIAQITTSSAWASTTNLTVECLFKANNTNDIKGLFADYVSGQNGTWLLWQRSGKIGFLIYQSGDRAILSTTSLVSGTVYHVAGTYDGSTMRLYINGTQESTLSIAAGTLATGSRTIQAGAYGGSGGNYSEANMNGVAFYNTALSGARIAAHFAAL